MTRSLRVELGGAYHCSKVRSYWTAPPESWPGLSRPSTSSWLVRREKGVDARDERGHDGAQWAGAGDDHARARRFPDPDRPRHADGRFVSPLLDPGFARAGAAGARLSAGTPQASVRAADRVPRHARARRPDG